MGQGKFAKALREGVAKKKGVLGRAVDRARLTNENLAAAVEAESKGTRRPCADPLAHTAAREVAKDLRRLAAVFDDVGPGHAAVLRGFATRLDGAK